MSKPFCFKVGCRATDMVKSPTGTHDKEHSEQDQAIPRGQMPEMFLFGRLTPLQQHGPSPPSSSALTEISHFRNIESL